MGSRHIQGTVFARVKALLASGTLKKKPVWYDVVKAFPPLVEAKLTDVADKGRPPTITYREDKIRDLFYSRFPLLRKIPINCFEREGRNNEDGVLKMGATSFNSKSTFLPTIETLICKYKEIIQETKDHEKAVDQTIDWILKESEIAKVNSSSKDAEDAKQKTDTAGPEIDIMDLFKWKGENKK